MCFLFELSLLRNLACQMSISSQVVLQREFGLLLRVAICQGQAEIICRSSNLFVCHLVYSGRLLEPGAELFKFYSQFFDVCAHGKHFGMCLMREALYPVQADFHAGVEAMKLNADGIHSFQDFSQRGLPGHIFGGLFTGFA